MLRLVVNLEAYQYILISCFLMDTPR